MRRRSLVLFSSAALVATALAAPAALAAPRAGHPSGHPGGHPGGHSPGDHPVVMYASDGMRPDLMQRFAGEHLMPTYAELMNSGATGDNGVTQGFPPNTGQGWSPVAPGAYPGSTAAPTTPSSTPGCRSPSR